MKVNLCIILFPAFSYLNTYLRILRSSLLSLNLRFIYLEIRVKATKRGSGGRGGKKRWGKRGKREWCSLIYSPGDSRTGAGTCPIK